MRARFPVTFLGLLLWVGPSALAVSAGDESDRLAAIDRVWAERNRDFDGKWAGAEPIGQVVAGLEELVAADPLNLTLINRLLQALEFQGQFTARDEPTKRPIFERGVAVASAVLTEIHGSADLGGSDPEELARQAEGWEGAGELHFWSAVHWGLFGETQGAMKALRRGVAKKIRTHAETAILLAPEVQRGGPYRVLGRMHAVAPKVPMVTGWIKREEAVVLLETAYGFDPTDWQNQQFVFEIWLDQVPAKRGEALAGLRALAAAVPRREFLAEDTRISQQVAEVLADL